MLCYTNHFIEFNLLVANENVGVICTVNGKQVVEYSKISDEAKNMKLDEYSEELVFNAANICNHFMTFQFLNEVCL
jgi:UDP-N-acetylglucosamine/UDP-N-acetylgalactosamine diphosphorylase